MSMRLVASVRQDFLARLEAVSRIGRLGILPRRGHKIVATGGASWRRCRRHRRGTRGIRAEIPYSPGRNDSSGCVSVAPAGAIGRWAREPRACAWPDCRRTAFHPWLQPAAPPGLYGQNLRITMRDVAPRWANSAALGHYPAGNARSSSSSQGRQRLQRRL
jgi:hypothetical protein